MIAHVSDVIAASILLTSMFHVFGSTSTKFNLNPFCEIAVEEAIRIKESRDNVEVIAVSIGSSVCQEQIRTALALGADRGILVETENVVEPLSVAKVLKQIVLKEQIDLVILGKLSIDSDNNQVGQMLAALLDYPQGTFACKAELSADDVTVGREVDGGEQTVRLKLPAIVTTDLRLNEPRYASLPNIMKAKKKPIDIKSAEELGVDIKPRIENIKISEPPTRQKGVMVADVAELVQKLKYEAKVI